MMCAAVRSPRIAREAGGRYRRCVNTPDTAAPPPDAPAGNPKAVEEFISHVRSLHPRLDLGTPVVRKYGDSASMSRRIIGVILSGAKTGGFSPLIRYERTSATLPQVGQCCLVTEFDGTPALLYRIVEVEVVPYDDVVERHTEIEAPELRPLDAWRKFHWVFWSREFTQYGEELTGRSPIVFQRFELLHPRPGTQGL